MKITRMLICAAWAASFARSAAAAELLSSTKLLQASETARVQLASRECETTCRTECAMRRGEACLLPYQKCENECRGDRRERCETRCGVCREYYSDGSKCLRRDDRCVTECR